MPEWSQILGRSVTKDKTMSNSDTQRSGCLIKTVIISGIVILQCLISAAMASGPRWTMNPIVSIIGFMACAAVIAWKPKNVNLSSTEIKPLDKSDANDGNP